VTVVTAQGRVRARLSAATNVAVGERVGLSFVSDKISVFDAGTGRVLRSQLHEAVHG